MSSTPAPTAVSKIVFFDNNFIRALLEGKFDAQLGDPNSELCRALEPPFTPWRTPFSFMELIGLNPKKILPRPEAFDSSTVNNFEFIIPAYRHYEAHFASFRELDRDSLRIRAETQRTHVSSRHRRIWDAVMTGLFSDRDESEWLRFALAFDHVHKNDIPANDRAHYRSNLIAGGFFMTCRHVRNLSKFRLAYCLWLRTHEKLTGRGTSEEQKRILKETQDSLKIGSRDDYVDGDLIHIAALGIEREDGTRCKVTCLTCDNPKTIVIRTRLYKGLLSYVRKLYAHDADSEGCPRDYETSHNGEVICFSSTGTLVRRIDVSCDAPPLPFLGIEPSTDSDNLTAISITNPPHSQSSSSQNTALQSSETSASFQLTKTL